MAYPTYNVLFTGNLEDLAGNPKGEINTNGSHAFVLKSSGTRVSVDLTHNSPNDLTPKLIIRFE